MKQNIKRATLYLMLWTLAWVLSVALASFGPRFLWGSNKFLTLIALLLNIGVGLGMILCNRHVLNTSDELQRKIQTDAMAFTLGSTLVGGICYSIMDGIDFISGDAEISRLVVFMTVVYLVSIIFGMIRYS